MLAHPNLALQMARGTVVADACHTNVMLRLMSIMAGLPWQLQPRLRSPAYAHSQSRNERCSRKNVSVRAAKGRVSVCVRTLFEKPRQSYLGHIA
jgi:hypothetical protein